MTPPKGKRIPDLAEDRPIDRAIDDRLDRIPFVENLARALIREEKDLRGRVLARRSTGIVVGLTGQWGLGKSSILNLLAEHLRATEHVVVATFNPWLFKGRDELFFAFFNELRDALGRSPQERVRQVVGAIEKYQDAISLGLRGMGLAADHAGAGGAGSAVAKAASDAASNVRKPRELSPQEERRSLEKKLEQAKVAVVVLIDELDRVDDEDVRAVAQLVKAVGDIKGVSYLVAYDPDRVSDALGRGTGEERRRTGEAYIEKIVQHPIPLRPLFTNDVAAMLNALLEHHELGLPDDLSEEELTVVKFIRNTIATPRELKRLVGSYAVLDRMLRREVSPADLLGYCWILTKAPGLRDAIANNLDSLVDDPDLSEVNRRAFAELAREKPELSAVLGAAVGPHEELLCLLFPRFGTSRRSDAGNRISRRRNLVRVLYLGDPPGIANRETVERLWNEPDETALCDELRRLLIAGELRPIIDRLEDLLPKLPEAGDRVFWPALARALVRDHDWYLTPEDNRAIAEDAATCLLQLGLRDKIAAPRVKAVAEALIRANDLILIPFLLRKHFFRWGLTIHDPKESHGEFVFDRKETELLRDREIPRYLRAAIDGTLVRRIPNCEAIFAIANTDRWNDGARASLTSQLEASEARASFAALMVPPGYSVDRKSLDQLTDADTVLARMKAAREGRKTASWIDSCLRRLRLSLSGRSPMFSGDDDEDDEDE